MRVMDIFKLPDIAIIRFSIFFCKPIQALVERYLPWSIDAKGIPRLHVELEGRLTNPWLKFMI